MGTYRACGGGCRYLDRRAERLVVEGFRRFMSEGGTGSIAGWERVADFFAQELGTSEASRLLPKFFRWLHTLNDFMERPATSSPFECPMLCRDECMVVAMIAASQWKDRDSLTAATNQMVAPEGFGAATEAAEAFAEALIGTGHHLMPVPAAVLRDIAERPARQAFH